MESNHNEEGAEKTTEEGAEKTTEEGAEKTTEEGAEKTDEEDEPGKPLTTAERRAEAMRKGGK